MARIFHKFKSKIGLSIFALCLTFCLIGSSAGVLSVSNAQKRVAESTTNTEAEQIEQSATDNQGRTYWDYNANGSNVYDGSIQTFTAPITAKFMLEAWGASGGGSAGGYGAYSVSYVDLTAGNTVLILVGKAGGQGGKLILRRRWRRHIFCVGYRIRKRNTAMCSRRWCWRTV